MKKLKISIEFRSRAQWIHQSVEILFFVYIISIFLTLGADLQGQYEARLISGSFLIGLAMFLYAKNWLAPPPLNPTLLLLGGFCLYELFRSCWAMLFLYIGRVPDSVSLPLQRYMQSSFLWVFYGAFLFTSFSWFTNRYSVRRLFYVMAWTGFFIALNAIPPLMKYGRGHFGYDIGEGERVFFYPLFYFADWVSQYVVARYAHVNWVGDIMAFGLFAALGWSFYLYEMLKEQLREKSEGDQSEKHKAIAAFMLLYLTLAMTTAAAIMLLFARGTIISFVAAFLLFMILMLLKFPSPRRRKFVVWIIVVTFGFLLWAGNLPKAWKEVRTVAVDLDPSQESSLATSREGMRRAVMIYTRYPMWGIGTEGYSTRARQFAKKTEKPSLEFDLADFQAMSHYFQLLAEEGQGALLYYLFLGAYFYEMYRGLRRTRSRFKYTMALALFCVVVMILIHASIHHLMQRFPISLLTYIAMGASLAIIRPDFHHHYEDIFEGDQASSRTTKKI